MANKNTPITKLVIPAGGSKEELVAMIKARKPKEATHFRFTKEGGKRGRIDRIKEAEHYAGLNGTFEFAKRKLVGKDNSFDPLPIRDEGDIARPTRMNTGYVDYMHELLLEGVSKARGDTFPRSKHTASEAVELVLAKFPDKDPASCRKIVRIRPRAVERMKTGIGEKYDDADPKKRAPRWALAAK